MSSRAYTEFLAKETWQFNILGHNVERLFGTLDLGGISVTGGDWVSNIVGFAPYKGHRGR